MSFDLTDNQIKIYDNKRYLYELLWEVLIKCNVGFDVIDIDRYLIDINRYLKCLFIRVFEQY